ncbi:hypothetical protein JYU34_006123 [Plutella xylostella]|uniref:Uncharacterized protein n=1 Tax=Plutella xylostella TaxID=51655 RepID=A0ABQ7QUY1_PLUXY|nr:hypothetical protein JYU34_006123 [Plutella xylostella]
MELGGEGRARRAATAECLVAEAPGARLYAPCRWAGGSLGGPTDAVGPCRYRAGY